ncbi:MAG: glycosyltransferase [Planctomycetes bacterium SCN 63-9]|nr:MAG: glycosyltransferase [Planctomycetes bacterium SCN 63-9]
MDSPFAESRVLVACPDSRPPAYQAVIGLDRAGLLERFLTAFYYKEGGRIAGLARGLAPARFARWEGWLNRRRDSEIPSERVRSIWSFDLALRVESRLSPDRASIKRAVVRWRTDRFDRQLAAEVARIRPSALFVFSDVGSEFTLPACCRLGIPTILSMVHGDVREEREILAVEESAAPEFFPLYLGDGVLDREELSWLHDRRLKDIALADRILVPSEHIRDVLIQHGTEPEKVSVIPYAADTRRFRPRHQDRRSEGCTFLFTGGITQRKGIKYLLEAWRQVRRPGWKLQLLGGLPKQLGPLEAYLEDVELLGRVPHSEVPDRMANADVFVFPSLFEGSAVVTYEALASGLPCVATPGAGSVVRDGVEGFLVPPRDVAALAERMKRLGLDAELRARMGHAARARAEEYDWPHYHRAICSVVTSELEARSDGRTRPEERRKARARR